MEVSNASPQVPAQLSKTVKALREEAAKNATFNAVAHIFAVRQRARQQVTLHRLQVAMTDEGFSFSKEQYEGVLKFLASLGLGIIDHDAKGRIRALKNIKVTLQSIGLAAIARKTTFDKYSTSTRFIKLPVVKSDTPEAESASTQPPVKALVAPPAAPEPSKARQYATSLTVTVNGEDIKFELPTKATLEEFVKMLAGFHGAH